MLNRVSFIPAVLTAFILGLFRLIYYLSGTGYDVGWRIALLSIVIWALSGFVFCGALFWLSGCSSKDRSNNNGEEKTINKEAINRNGITMTVINESKGDFFKNIPVEKKVQLIREIIKGDSSDG